MGVKLRKRKTKIGTSFYLDIIHNGDRWTETLNLTASRGNMQSVKEQAETTRAKRELELQADEHDIVPAFKRNSSFLDYYKKYAEHYDKGDGNALRSSYKKFEAFIGKDKDISFKQLNHKICTEFRDYLLTIGLRGEAAPGYFAKFKKVIKQASVDKFLSAKIIEGIRISISDCPPTDPKETLTPEEIMKLAETPCSNTDVYRAFLFCCVTGLRTPEAKAFCPKKILFIKDIPHIDIAQKKGVNPKPKLIPLNDLAVSLLGHIKDANSEEPVFHLPTTQNGINKVLKGWTKKAGIEKHITFYCARHSFGTQLMAGGVDPRTVAGLLGHSSLKYIVRYAHEVDENKINAVIQLNGKLKAQQKKTEKSVEL